MLHLRDTAYEASRFRVPKFAYPRRSVETLIFCATASSQARAAVAMIMAININLLISISAESLFDDCLLGRYGSKQSISKMFSCRNGRCQDRIDRFR